MIEHYFRPDSTAKALELMQQHSATATWFAGGSKLNAAPSKTEKTVAISLEKLALDKVELRDNALHIGAMCKLQKLIDNELVPEALKQAAGFIYSRHVRNQATIGGEIAALQQEALVIPTLLALKARVVLATGGEKEVEEYIAQNERDLITEIIVPDTELNCIGYNITRSAAGLSVVTAAVSIDAQGQEIIALGGVSPQQDGFARPIRLRDVENQNLKGELLEKAVAEAIHPVADYIGSVEYKRYIAGVVVTDLLTECQQLAEEA